MKHSKSKDNGLSVVFSPSQIHGILIEKAKHRSVGSCRSLIKEE